MPDALSRLEELTLVLLHQAALAETGNWPLRSARGYDGQVVNRLRERGLVGDPGGRAPLLTEQGRARAEQLLALVGAGSGGLLAPTCACGCGEETAAGHAFRPGHDQRLRAALEVRVGGLLALRALVDAVEAYARGRSSDFELGRAVREAFRGRAGAAEAGAVRPKPVAGPAPRQATLPNEPAPATLGREPRQTPQAEESQATPTVAPGPATTLGSPSGEGD